ncbi:MAG: aminopeptidase P family protein, partial [bacterium]|nr:aminopeptidase P family protein [bacterium]
MKFKKTIILAILLSLLYLPGLNAVTNNPYLSRRQNVLVKMSPKGLVILQTNRQGYRWGFGFQQESNLFYLTGMSEPDIVLILSKPGIPNSTDENSIVHSILIANPPAHQASNNEAYYQTLQDSLGFDLVCGTKEYRKIFKSISAIDTLYTNIIAKNQKDGKTILENRLIKLLEEMPQIEVVSPGRLTASLRMIKDAGEIDLMQKAIDITTLSHKEAFKSMTPGLFEYQIEAVIEYVFKFNGSQQLAFPSIVGSGPNSLDLHYELGVRKIEAGDMVVMDIGCEYNHYCADITRTIPASGKFTPQQKEIYNIVLEANQAVINMLKPGVTMAQMDSLARAVFARYDYEKYWRHGCTHHLGLDVHDVGDTRLPLAPGCVVTVEPGLYIPPNSDLPKEYWNIGVRIEDDVLITENGHRVLTAGCP